MPNAENAQLQFESGQTSYAMGALTDSGDATIFTSSATLFSGADGYEPDVRPDGLATGGVVSAATSGSNDVVDVAALTCYLAGVLTTVSAGTDESITRPVTDVAKINSITISSAGAIVVIAGTDSADSSFATDRGSAGSAPYIPVGSVEIAQVRLSTSAAAVIASTEIFQTIGVHQERYDSPLYTITSEDAAVEFNSSLDLIHTADVPKGVYASYADPIFADVELASDFVPSENSHSVSSTQIYGTTLGASSSSLSQGTFTAYVSDGVTDAIVKAKDDTLWFKFYPNRYKAPYILDQGKLGMSRAFPAGDNLSCACTISATSASVGVES